MKHTVVRAMGDLIHGAVISIGIFDGVHVGHQTLLARQRALAEKLNAPMGVVTFFPPARTIFSGAKYLTNAEEKALVLAEHGATSIAMVPFSVDYTETPKDAFLAELASIRPRGIVVGPDFRFGHNRSGDINDLRTVCSELIVQELVRTSGDVVSSTRIRDALAAGKIEVATKYLGRGYSAMGTIITGEKRGRTIGFPTANFDMPEEKALPLGVFVVRSIINGKTVYGIANVGPRPTFPTGAPSLEVHYLDFDGDLYGATLTVEFLHFLRHQERFTGLDSLTAQLEQDRLTAYALIAEHHQ